MGYSEKEFVDRVYMTVFGLVGFIIFCGSAGCFDLLPDTCTNPLIMNCLNILLITGSIMASLSVVYWICIWKSGSCYAASDKATNDTFLSLSFLLALFILIMDIICIARITNSADCKGYTMDSQKNFTDVKIILWFIFGIAILVLIACSIMIWYTNVYIPSKLTRGLNEAIQDMEHNGYRFSTPPAPTHPITGKRRGFFMQQ